jgi:HAMP domain-containing protein
VPEFRVTVPTDRADDLRNAFASYKLSGNSSKLVAYIEGRTHAERTLAEIQAHAGTTGGTVDSWDAVAGTWRAEDGTALAGPGPRPVDEAVGGAPVTEVVEGVFDALTRGLWP